MSPERHASQRKNSLKSGMRTMPGQRDCGQRFEVRYRDGMGTERVYGFAQAESERDRFVREIEHHPIWSKPRVLDRGAA